MQEHHLSYLCCPNCRSHLEIHEIRDRSGSSIREGALRCSSCGASFPILRSIPRFVPVENYASSFGLQWNRHDRTQYDASSGIQNSVRRFFEETKWPRDLQSEVILEAGSGSGRFTEPAATTGAMVVSADYSSAVEANYRSNGGRPNVLIVQADIVQMPFHRSSFDRVFCFGVLQHTPDPKRSLFALQEFLKPGGALAVDIYKKTFAKYVLGTKYWVRPVTKRLPPQTLYKLTKSYIDFMWPLASVVRRIPRIGVPLNWRLLVADYSKEGLTGERLREWAYLDTFDMLSPRFDSPATLSTFRKWFEEMGLDDVEVHYGYNGIEGRGRRSTGKHVGRLDGSKEVLNR